MAKRDEKKASLLIVDNNSDSAFLLGVVFGRRYNCQTASSVEEASRLLGCGYYDILVTDVELSGESGLNLCEVAKTIRRDTIVVVMSAFQQYRTEALKRGAFDFLLKPFETERLQTVINQALIARDFEVAASDLNQ